MNILHLVAVTGNTKVADVLLRYLLEGGVSKQSMELIMSPISLSVMSNQIGMTYFFLGHNFNVNIANIETGEYCS